MSALSSISEGISYNQLLNLLPKSEYERLVPHLFYVELRIGETLYMPGEKISHVYFPFSGMISVTVDMLDGSGVEVGVVGREGIVGLPMVLGTGSAPMRASVHMPVSGMRLRADVFTSELKRGGQLNLMLLRYTQAFYVQTAIIAACNRLHQIEGRLARWLLTCNDRLESDTLQVTHEFLADLLGVRRAGVTEAVGALQSKGLITCHRGHIQIVYGKGLQRYSCECYELIRDEYQRLIGKEPTAHEYRKSPVTTKAHLQK
jgi:CRP-like cAMP-binding protein